MKVGGWQKWGHSEDDTGKDDNSVCQERLAVGSEYLCCYVEISWFIIVICFSLTILKFWIHDHTIREFKSA
jgi:hypothetical protein